MQNTIDWKFYVTLIATLAGIIVPVWLWEMDLQAKSLQFRIASQTPLMPEVPNGVAGLNLSIDGVQLERPYLTVLEFTNDGSRPIPASEYEDSIQLLVSKEAKIVRAQVTDTHPKNIQPKLTNDTAIISLSPLLLNPEDVITFAIITTGGKPTFNVNARVAGISAVLIDDRVTRHTKTKTALLSLLVILLLFVYMSCALAIWVREYIQLQTITIMIATLASLLGSILFMLELKDDFTLSASQLYLLTGVIGVIVSGFATRLNKRRRREPTQNYRIND